MSETASGTGVASLKDRTEERRVVAWRAEILKRAGYDGYLADALAGAKGIDLHLAVRLLQTGCPPRTALRILL